MRHQRSFTRRIFPLLILTPYIVAFKPDSSSTIVRFGAGIGSYADVSRDCSGNIVSVEEIPFTDAAIGVEHERGPLKLAAKAGVVSEKRKEEHFGYTSHGYVELPPTEEQKVSTYINPSMGFHWKYFGLDAGCIWVRGDGFGEMSVTSKAIPQGAIRIGNRDSWFWSMGVFDNLPLLSRGAPIDMGLGFALDQRRSTLWLGVGAGVYDGTVYAAKSDIAVGERWLLNVGLTAGGNGQVAASLGAGIRF